MEDKYRLPSLKDARKRNKEEIKVERALFEIPDQARSMGVGKKYFLRTYGCQANQRDSETISGILNNLGFTMVDHEEQADVLIFNTCAVRKNAEDKVIGELGLLKRLKRVNPDLIFVLCGCM
ncbi:MAG: tRNA (N6-isopentenyl adenosine(37)-C2)-methylthiotransferase MiaB, partial [Erysipelotrichaceae bacterium]|nr:tRNA (N6-isopentenyl adenosine(37)-C2)-methylthiotransferase MiaB [Erysipelotrichaceae bacterium]